MRPLLGILLFVTISMAAGIDADRKGYNITAWGDTAKITTLAEAGTVRYTTKCWEITDGNPLRLICMVNDTDAAGFSNDSMALEWGYQTGARIINASGNLDTIWYNRVIVDTILTANYGAATAGTQSTAGVPTMVTAHETDTSAVTGFAVMSRVSAPLFDEFLRLWANGLTGQNKTAIKLQWLVKSRIYSPVRNK